MKNFITLGKVLSISFCWFFNLIQSQSSGILDPDFNGNGKLSFSFSQQSDYCSDVAIDNNQKIIAAGSSNLSGKKCFAIARLNPDGSFDNSFSSDGKVQTVIANSDANLSKILIQPDNKILAAGSNGNGFVIARYLTNGDLDNSFSFDGIVTTAVSANFGAAALDKNGNIYLVGGKGAIDSNIVIAKYRPDGSLDQNFGSAGIKTVAINTDPQPRFIQIDANGNMVIIGDYIKSSVKYIFYTRLTPTGNYDISVLGTNRHKSLGFSASARCFDVAMDLDSSYIVAAVINEKLGLAKLTANGSVLGQFGNAGRIEADFGYKSILPGGIAIQPDGKILVSGSSVLQNFFQRFWTARFLANGNIDSDFGINGLLEVSFNETLNDKTYNSRSVLQKDGRFLSSGSFEKSGKANFVLFRVVTGLTLSVADEQSFAPLLTAYINDEGSIDVISSSKTHLQLYDMSGRLIGEYIVYPGKQTLPIHLNSRGSYIILAERNKTMKLIRY